MTDVPEKYAHLQRWAFGDNPKLADELLALVLIGKKTASCGALWQYEQENWPVPKPGDLAIVLDGAQKPRCVIETTSADIKRFDQVDAQFAHDEGEGDQSYAFWRGAHEEYFTRQGRFSPDMLVVCERFRLIEVLTPAKESVQ
ncbi:MAG: ASCH domain-containing protein [Alphaproteobacteria bacterium]|nr:ASCH domain-containing protein [Alphaproteobacteria bacterium]